MGVTLTVLSLLLEGVLSGVFLCSALVEHAERTLDAPAWIAYKQAKERVFGPVMPVFFGVTLASSILGAALPPLRVGPIAVVLLLAAALAITVSVHLPLNKVFQSWSSMSFSPQWKDDRRRWRDWNWARCALALGAFGVALTVRT